MTMFKAHAPPHNIVSIREHRRESERNAAGPSRADMIAQTPAYPVAVQAAKPPMLSRKTAALVLYVHMVATTPGMTMRKWRG